MDKQAVEPDSSFYKVDAETVGEIRKAKLDKLYERNHWVDIFYAEHTFEIEFANTDKNYNYIIASLDKIYIKQAALTKCKQLLSDEKSRNEEIFALSKKEGKGWMATIIAGELDFMVSVPDYITDAIAFAAQETMSLQIYTKMITYSLSCYNDDNISEYIKKVSNASDKEIVVKCIKEILNDSILENDVVVRFIKKCEKNCLLLGEDNE